MPSVNMSDFWKIRGVILCCKCVSNSALKHIQYPKMGFFIQACLKNYLYWAIVLSKALFISLYIVIKFKWELN